MREPDLTIPIVEVARTRTHFCKRQSTMEAIELIVYNHMGKDFVVTDFSLAEDKMTINIFVRKL